MTRNPFCRKYLECLSVAAHANEPLECKGCELENDHAETGFTRFELAGIYALITAICQPDDYHDHSPQQLIREFAG